MPRLKQCRGPDCEVRKPREEMLGPMREFCSTDCGFALARIRQEKARQKAQAKAKREAAAKQKAERAELRKRKEKLKKRQDWQRVAQQAFNRYIRIRDRGLPCISCGRPEGQVESEQGWKPGGAWDAGHFLSVGSHPELRFEESNCHRQCKSCNGGAGRFGRKNRTVSQEYEDRLVKRIGQAKVDWLKGPHDAAKLSSEDLAEIKNRYKIKASALEKSHG